MNWFLILVAVLVGVIGYKILQEDKKKTKKLPKRKQRGLTNLKVNDIVSYLGTDYLVEGKLIYEEDGDEWYDYRLVDGDDEVWLSVEEDDRLEAYFFRMVDDLKFTQRPPEFIEYRGERFELEEYGRAKVTRDGKTGRKSAGSCKYFEYESENDTYLSIEQWGEGSFEVSYGEEIRPSLLEILPGDEVMDDEF